MAMVAPMISATPASTRVNGQRESLVGRVTTEASVGTGVKGATVARRVVSGDGAGVAVSNLALDSLAGAAAMGLAAIVLGMTARGVNPSAETDGATDRVDRATEDSGANVANALGVRATAIGRLT